jgi:hypothetical protein
MELQAALNKENFWNGMMVKFPKATKLFCEWIDQYKKAVSWDNLFNNYSPASPTDDEHMHMVKFHDIPYAMQQGIWIEFVMQTLHKYFEQPEYNYSLDLEQDIKTFFSEIEDLL